MCITEYYNNIGSYIVHKNVEFLWKYWSNVSFPYGICM